MFLVVPVILFIHRESPHVTTTHGAIGQSQIT